jgi:hypothetical protein
MIYGSDDDDGDEVVAKPLARRASVAVVDLCCTHLLPTPPNNERKYDDDNDDEMDGLPPLPNTQNLMAMVRAIEKRTNHPSTEAAFDSQATTLVD